MVEWGVCGEGKEWEGLCVGMPSIARAAAGNDANPRLQPATSQTDNEHDASLRRRIPPLAATLPCHRHPVNHPTVFSAEGKTSVAGSRPPMLKKFFFSPCSGSSAACPVPPPKRPGKLRTGKPARRRSPGVRKNLPCPKTSFGQYQPGLPPAVCDALSTRPVASGILVPPT